MSPKLTDFGFERVPRGEKQQRVGAVFDSVAERYDLMNDLMSFGIHRLWKRFTVTLCAVREGHRVLDLAGGTGDLAVQLASRVGDTGQVVLADINHAMLEAGRDRLIDTGEIHRVRFVQANAERLPFAADSFDRVCIAFGLRNVTDKTAALQSMLEVLRPGGSVAILEFSKLELAAARPLYDTYSFKVLPLVGVGGSERPGPVPVSRGIDSDASRPGDAAPDDGAGGFRALHLSQPRGRYRGVASRIQDLMPASFPLSALEKALNHCLSLDPYVGRHLEILGGQSIEIALDDSSLSIIVTLGPDRVSIGPATNESTPDARLSGSIPAFVKMFAEIREAKPVYGSAVSISGDVEVVQKLRRLLTELEIDWEEHLARWVGDGAAHGLGLVLKSVHAWARDTHRIFWLDLGEYLAEETRLLPRADEVASYLADVDEVRDEVERLSVRVTRLG